MFFTFRWNMTYMFYKSKILFDLLFLNVQVLAFTKHTSRLSTNQSDKVCFDRLAQLDPP